MAGLIRLLDGKPSRLDPCLGVANAFAHACTFGPMCYSVGVEDGKQCVRTQAGKEESVDSKGDILVVDDDPDFCEVMKTTLEEGGFTVRCAPDGSSGMRMMRERKPDLVFLDVIMVSPTEGASVSEEIFEDPELRHVPIVMVTSIIDTEYIGWFPTDRPLHVDLFVEKPVPMSKVLELANRFAAHGPAAV